tara:strand:+ start:16291 stop:16773 length:483 start_codon:yes stop_codon:yes gene_type:complete
MSDNPNLRKNGGKGTFFGNLLRGAKGIGLSVGSPILNAVTGGKVSDIVKAITGNTEISEVEKEMLLKELEQDVTEMQEVSKRWSSDMQSDSWLSKNIRPLSLGFLTIALFLYIILDSLNIAFEIKERWVNLLGDLLMLVYAGYFGARALEKITKMRQSGK